jgi:DNA-binding CsgD family transcriptional regulator
MAHTGLVREVICAHLVGRGAELAAVESRRTAARRGAGGILFVTGEAGIGKSRLVREVAVTARRDGALLTGRAVSGGTPFRPLSAGDADLGYFPAWQHVGRLLVAEAARRDGWGKPDRWLDEARANLTRYGLTALARRADRLRSLDEAGLAGVTAREQDVLALLTTGLSNRAIADRLHLSVRTVEKHVESLLRKAGARSRTHLAAMTRVGGNT